MAWTHVYIYKQLYCIYVCTSSGEHIHIHTYIQMYMSIYIYMYIYIHIYIYLYLSTCEVLWITLCGWRSLPDDPEPAQAKPTNCNYGVTSFIRGSRTKHMGRKMIDCDVVVVTSFIRSSSRTTKEIIILLLNALFMYITSCVYHCQKKIFRVIMNLILCTCEENMCCLENIPCCMENK